MERQKIVIGKIGPRYLGPYSTVTRYLVADCVQDEFGNIFISKKGTSTSVNVGHALPVVKSDGTASTSDWWALLFNFSQLRKLVEDATQSCVEQTEVMNENVSESISQMQTLKSECEEMADYLKRALVPKLIGEPTILKLHYLSEICIKNSIPQKINVELKPQFCSQSAIFNKVEGDSLGIDPGGNLIILKAGKTKFQVIPTYNTKLWQEVEINVRQPLMRMASAGTMRLSNGKIRIY